MASQQPPVSARDAIRASERALGYHVAQGTQAWASVRRPGLDRPMRSTRLPTSRQAPQSTPVPTAHAAAANQSVAAEEATTQAAAARADGQPYDDGQHQDAGYGTDDTESYEAVGDNDNQLRILQLEQEVAQLRLQIHHLQTELIRQRRIHRQAQDLNQLSTGAYWISRARR